MAAHVSRIRARRSLASGGVRGPRPREPWALLPCPAISAHVHHELDHPDRGDCRRIGARRGGEAGTRLLPTIEAIAEMIQGSCLCGAVQWRFEGMPESATACNCTACRRYGALWAYDYEGEGINVTGPTRMSIFRRGFPFRASSVERGGWRCRGSRDSS